MAGIGFLIAVIIKAIGFYIGSSAASTYSYLIQTQLFAPQHILEYLMTAAMFAGLGILIIYVWKQNRSITKMIFRK